MSYLKDSIYDYIMVIESNKHLIIQARKISMRFQKKMGLENIVSLAASPIVARKRQSDSPCVRRKVGSWTIRDFAQIDKFDIYFQD